MYRKTPVPPHWAWASNGAGCQRPCDRPSPKPRSLPDKAESRRDTHMTAESALSGRLRRRGCSHLQLDAQLCLLGWQFNFVCVRLSRSPCGLTLESGGCGHTARVPGVSRRRKARETHPFVCLSGLGVSCRAEMHARSPGRFSLWICRTR